MLNFFLETLFYEKMTINSTCMKWTEIGHCPEHFRLFIVSCHFQFIFIKGCYIIAGVCHQQRRVTLPWALRLCLRGKVGGKTRITPFDFILVDFPYFWRSRGGFRKKTSVPFYCSWCLPLLKEVKKRLDCRVSLRSGQQKENIHQNWLLWGQIFPWAWLGSAWSYLVLVRNDPKKNFQT